MVRCSVWFVVRKEFPSEQRANSPSPWPNRPGNYCWTIYAAGCRADDPTETGHFDIVTEADIASERLILEALRDPFPSHGIHAEEDAGRRLPDDPWFWVVDPIDGTTNFSHGLPIFAVNMALIRGAPMLSVTHDPSAGRTYWAERWRRMGAPRTGHTAEVSATASLDRAVLATGFVSGPQAELSPQPGRVHCARSALAVGEAARLGSDSAGVDRCWPLRGVLGGLLKPWDWIPGWLLIPEAGGRVTERGHRRGRRAFQDVSLVASNGQTGIHDEILATIAGVRAQSARH